MLGRSCSAPHGFLMLAGFVLRAPVCNRGSIKHRDEQRCILKPWYDRLTAILPYLLPLASMTMLIDTTSYTYARFERYCDRQLQVSSSLIASMVAHTSQLRPWSSSGTNTVSGRPHCLVDFILTKHDYSFAAQRRDRAVLGKSPHFGGEQ